MDQILHKTLIHDSHYSSAYSPLPYRSCPLVEPDHHSYYHCCHVSEPCKTGAFSVYHVIDFPIENVSHWICCPDSWL